MNDTLTNFTSNVTQYVAPAITYIPPSRIVPFLPDGVFFLLCGILAVIVYYYLPDEAKKGVKNFIIGYGFWIVMLIFVLYYKNKWGLVRENSWPGEIHQVYAIAGLVILVVWGATSWLYEQRYKTHHLIADNISGSCHRYEEIQSTITDITWVVFFLGTSGSSDKNFVIPWPWCQEILVVPKTAFPFILN